MEEWRIIIGFENYAVSNLGNVKSVRKFLKPYKGKSDRDKYYRVHLHRKHKKVHKLVAEAFIPNPLNLPEVNHIDGNRWNNNVWNLEWSTHNDNMHHASINNLLKQGEDHTSHKLTQQQVMEIRSKYIPRKYSMRMLAREYNVSSPTIIDIINRKYWKHI